VDPELTYNLPPPITASSGLDALTQLIEPFVSVKANPMTDAICREGMHHAAQSLRRAYENGADKEAREGMALASLFGGMALANAALGAVHGFAGHDPEAIARLEMRVLQQTGSPLCACVGTLGAIGQHDVALQHFRRYAAPQLRRALERLRTSMADGPALAYSTTKVMLTRELDMDLSGALEMDSMTQALLMTTHDHAEFHAAFNEKRKPDWKGR
jgi:isochorismate synthase EntC